MKHTLQDRRSWLRACALCALAFFPAVAQAAQPADTACGTAERQEETPEAKARRMAWFSQAKLGIFIHWGIYSRGDWSESWSFHNGTVSPEDYYAQCADFTASRYRPGEWARLIRQSGARYTVITAKHHDGFALWDTQVGGLSAPKSSSARRDVLSPFVEAVRADTTLRLGLYYSLIDWSRDDYPNMLRSGPPRYALADAPERWAHFLSFNRGQLRELDSLFRPDLWWFDGDWEFSSAEWDAPGIAAFLRGRNPGVILNSRIAGQGDYATPELGVPVTRPRETWWETCMTASDSWGYRKTDNNCKSPAVVIRMLCDCMSMGGNLLLDIGPRADGSIPEEQAALLREVGRWISRHAEAVYPTRAGIPTGHVQAYTTLGASGDVLYLYLPYVPTAPLEIKGLKSRIRRIRVVGQGGRELSWKRYNDVAWSAAPGVCYVDVPRSVADKFMTVLAVETEGPVALYSGSGQVIESNE